MASIEDVKVFTSILRRAENIFKELETIPYSKEEDLQSLLDKFKLHKQLLSQLMKLTNKGNFTATLRKKTDRTKAWLSSIEENIEKERSNKRNKKNVLLDISQIEKYKEYCEKVEVFFEDTFPEQYQEILSNSKRILENYDILSKNIRYFVVPQDIINPDLLRAEDDGFMEMDVAEPKNLTTIKPVIANIATTIKKVMNILSSIQDLEKELVSLDIKSLFKSLNTRNALFKSLLTNMVQLNKIIYQGEFYNNLQIRQAYQNLLDKIMDEYPALGSKLSNLTLQKQDPIQEEILSSMVGIKEQLEQDSVDTFVSPHYNKPISSDEIQYPQPPPLPSRSPNKTIDPQEKARYESMWREGDPITPEEKQKYEKLWAASSKMNQLMEKLSIKYGI